MSFGEGDLHAKIEELEAENEELRVKVTALEAELTQARGEAKVAYNNYAVQVEKLHRKELELESRKAELDRRLKQPLDEIIAENVRTAQERNKRLRDENAYLRDRLSRIREMAR